MSKFRLYFVENEYVNAVMFCDTLGIYNLSEEEKTILNQLNEGIEVPASSAKEKMAAILEKEDALLSGMSEKNCDENSFYTLILNVSNNCNMQCGYCFANHGVYNSKIGLMSEETAIKAVEACIDQFKFIGEIKFFGGEPLLALPVMRAVCTYVIEQKHQGKIDTLPEFRVISNGTIMNDEVVSLITDYDLHYVVSIDGLPDIHDAVRKMKNGSSSFLKIMENIRFLREKTGKPPAGIEITYNGVHEKNNVKIIDIIRFLEIETGVNADSINISPVMVDSNKFGLDNLNYVLSDYLDEIIDEKRRTERNYTDKKFRGLVKILKNRMRSGNQICEAGTGCICISAYGKIYPCLMFNDEQSFLMGDISDNFEWIIENFKTKLPNSRLKESPCSSCPVNRVCRECMGINRFQTGKIDTPYQEQCTVIIDRIGKAILCIAEGLFCD